jgi:hypothetical protein
MPLPSDPWYARLLTEALQRPVFCTIWLPLVLAAAVGLAYVAGPWVALASSAGGISSLAARLTARARDRPGAATGAAEPAAATGGPA